MISDEFDKQIYALAKMLEAENKRIEGLEDLIISSPDIIWRFDVGAMPEETRAIGVNWLMLVYMKKRELEVARRAARAKDPAAV